MIRYLAALLVLLHAGPAAAATHTDVTEAYKHRDYSALILPKRPFVGYVGDMKHRLFIVYETVEQDTQNPTRYRIKGYAKINDSNRPFEGTLNVKEVRQLEQMHYGPQDKMRLSGMQAQGFILAEYTLDEQPRSQDFGQYIGTMKLNWYSDKDGVLRYDDIESASPSYINNLHEGLWVDYETRSGIPALWSDGDIPRPGQLETSIQQSAPLRQFDDKGWRGMNNGR